MTYTKTTWKDRVVEKPRNYTMANNADGSVTLTPSPGVVTEAGTPIIAANLNNIEEGIANAHTQLQVINANYPLHSIHRQAIINGNFDIWQRNTSGNMNFSGQLFVADRWKAVSYTGNGSYPTITHSRGFFATTELAGSRYCYRITTTGNIAAIGANDYIYLSQSIENGVSLLCHGNKVSVSFYARSSIANKKISIYIAQYYGTGGSPSSGYTSPAQVVTLTSAWKKYVLTFDTVPGDTKTFGINNDDFLKLYFEFAYGTGEAASLGLGSVSENLGSGSIDFSQVQVNVGDTALPFQHKSFHDELLACMRYYEKSYSYNTAPGTANSWSGYTMFNTKSIIPNAGLVAQAIFKVRKRCQPTCNVYDCANGYINRIANISPYGSSTFECTAGEGELKVVNNSGGAATVSDTMIYFHWTADAEI